MKENSLRNRTELRYFTGEDNKNFNFSFITRLGYNIFQE